MGSQKQSMPALATASSTSAEILQAQAELWCHAYGYLKSMALHCAIKLGIPNAVSRCGGAASLSELHAALPVAPSRRPCLSRLMRFLASTGIFIREDDHDTTPASQEQAAGGDETRYRLTAVSHLLVDEDDTGGHNHTCLSPYVATCFVPPYLAACLRLAEWLETEDDDGGAAEAPFMMAHGTDLWGMIGRDAEFGAVFNGKMTSDSRFLARIVVRECGEAFTGGVETLVDVGGGDGTMAKVIAEAFPRVRCKVLELPQIVDGIVMPAAVASDGGGGGKVEFVAGDMMEFIPPADALLLKFILHDWNDQDCVRILKRCKEAVSPRGKVIIIDTVVGSASNQTLFEAQLLIDLAVMVLVPGEERDEQQWSRLFMDAGFTRYKISPVLGCRSLIELYP